MKKRTSKEIFAETLLELSEYTPLDRITVKQIAAKSGLSLKTFYNHFSDKYALMIYIEDRETKRLHAKLSTGDYSYHEYLVDGVHYYKAIRQFLQNAVNNTYARILMRKNMRRHLIAANYDFLLKKNRIDSVPQDIAFALRLCVAGLVEMFAAVYLYSDGMDADEFVRQCEEHMPEKLKPYLI